MFDPGERRSADWRLLRSGQFERLRHQRRLRSQVAQLGLLKSRVARYGGDESRVHRARREIATLSTFEVTPTKLPEPSSTLIGREQELAAVRAALEGDARVVTLLGPGGTGKTRLSIEAAFASRHQFAGGVHFVDLAPLTDASLVTRTIADVLEVPVRPGDQALAVLADQLRDKQLLLVLDNVEQVIDAAGDLATLLRAAGRVTILATSRQPLGISGEHEMPIPPLRLPAPGRLGAVATVAAIPAVALFVDRARAAYPDFRLTDANAEAVVEICGALDGLPLAIELAAARAGVLTAEAILERLRGQLGLLSDGARDAPERHQALRSTIDWSYDLLAPAEQVLFTHLGVFVDGAGLAAVEAVCNDASVLEALTSLRDKSLLRRVGGEGAEPRFVMLQTIREYALERLRSGEAWAEAQNRHADYFADLAENAELNLVGADQDIWAIQLDREVGNLRAALQWSEESGRLATGLRLASALARFWSMRGLTDPSDWITRVLRLGADVPPTVMAKALYADGYAALDHGDLTRAESCFEESVAAYRELDEPRGIAAGLAQLAFLLMSRGAIDQAVVLAEESAAGARDLGDANLESVALSTVADGAARRRDFVRARSLYQRSLELREQVGDRRNIANAMLNLGRVALTTGEHDTARQLLERGLGLARDVADTWSISVGLASLGRLELATDGAPAARPLLQDALRRATDRGGQRLAAECLNALALAVVDHDPHQAALLLGAAEARRRTIGVTLSPVEVSGTEGLGDRVRAALGKDTFEAQWAAGLTVDLEELLTSEVTEAHGALELVSAKEARKMAAVLVGAIGSATSVKVALVGDPVAFPGGWLFEHAPRSGDAAPAPVGPIVVLASGNVEVLDPAVPVATHLARRT
jgi:predicted ATPase